MAGLRFCESLAGYLGDADDFWAGYRDGRRDGRAVRFWVTVQIADLDAFLADPEHEATMSGRLTLAGLGGATVEGGRLHLFCPRGGEKRLIYYLPFRHRDAPYLLWGEKRLQKPRGLEAWRQMTTLYAELVRQSDGGPEKRLGRGVLRIRAGQVALQALSFRPIGTGNPLRALGHLARFLHFASQEIRR